MRKAFLTFGKSGFGFALLYGLMLLLATGCITRKACENRYGQCGNVETTTIIEHKDSLIYLAGATVRDTLIIPINGKDSIIERIVTDPQSLTTLRLRYETHTRRLLAECEKHRDTITVTNTVYRESKVKTITQEIPVTPDWVIAACVIAGIALVAWITFKIAKPKIPFIT